MFANYTYVVQLIRYTVWTVATCIIFLILTPGLVGIAQAQSNQTNSEDNTESDANSNLVKDTGTAQLVSATVLGLAGFGSLLSISIVKERGVVVRIISWYTGIWGCLAVILTFNASVIILAGSGELSKLYYTIAISMTAAAMAAIFFFRTMMIAPEIDDNERVARYRRMCRAAMGTYESK